MLMIRPKPPAREHRAARRRDIEHKRLGTQPVPPEVGDQVGNTVGSNVSRDHVEPAGREMTYEPFANPDSGTRNQHP